MSESNLMFGAWRRASGAAKQLALSERRANEEWVLELPPKLKGSSAFVVCLLAYGAGHMKVGR